MKVGKGGKQGLKETLLGISGPIIPCADDGLLSCTLETCMVL